MRAFLTAAAALAAVAAGPAFAAQDGVLGVSSTGNFNVSAEIVGENDVAQVSGLADFTFGSFEPGETFQFVDRICVFHTSPTVQVAISQTNQTSFQLVGPGDVGLPIEIGLNDFLPDRSERFFSQQINLTGVVGNRVFTDCSDFNTQGLFVRIPPVPAGQPPGLYSASFTVIVAVE